MLLDKMPKIIIMNNVTQQMLGDNISELAKSMAAKASWRNIWLAKEGDIVISPVPLQTKFLNYVGLTLGIDYRKLKIVVPKGDPKKPDSLTDDRLLEPLVISQIKTFAGKLNNWLLCPCYFTSGVGLLGEKLGLNIKLNLFSVNSGHDLFNRKADFRRMASGINLPVPKGEIVYSCKIFKDSIERNIKETGIVIVKQNKSAGSMGNVIITSELTAPLPGASYMYSMQEFLDQYEDIWSNLTDNGDNEFVVETYYKSKLAMYSEYLIGEDGIPKYLNSGKIKLIESNKKEKDELIWEGLEIPAQGPIHTMTVLNGESMRFANLASQMGYRGLINIDAIITANNRILFNEVNGRWGGGTVMHFLALDLLGSEYSNKFVISSFRNIKAKSFECLLESIKHLNLDYFPNKEEGCVIIASNEIYGDYECLFFAKSTERLTELFKSLMLEVSDGFKEKSIN